MGTIYFFLSGNVVYNDKILPIILELACQGNKVHSIFLSPRAFESIKRTRPYFEWLVAKTKVQRLITKEKLSFFDKCRLLSYVIFLVFQFGLRKNYLALFDTKGAIPITYYLSKIAAWRGRSVVYGAWYADAYKDFDYARWKNDQKYREIFGKQKKIEKSKHHLVPRKQCDALLLYNKDLAYKEDVQGSPRHLVVPHPKLQSWWREFFTHSPPKYDAGVLHEIPKWISVFLTHKGNFLFQEDSDIDVLLPEIVKSIRRVWPDQYIVIKPKQTVDKVWLAQYLGTMGDDKIVISESPVGILALKSIVGISTAHTTAQFEFMIGEAPWIEYCRYSDFWRKIYPKVTYTEEYSGYWAQTSEELNALLYQVKDGQLKNDLETFKKKINFYEQDISFDFFMK